MMFIGVFMLTYILWGPLLIISVLLFGSIRAVRRPAYALIYIPLSAAFAALLATPVADAFVPALPWWVAALNKHTDMSFLIQKVLNCTGIFAAVGFLFFLIGVFFRAINPKKGA